MGPGSIQVVDRGQRPTSSVRGAVVPERILNPPGQAKPKTAGITVVFSSDDDETIRNSDCDDGLESGGLYGNWVGDNEVVVEGHGVPQTACARST